MKRVLVPAVTALFLLVILAGCGGGSKDPVLATVGSRTIKASDFLEAYTKTPAKDRPDLSTLEAKKQFLRDLINRDIMEQAAFAKYPELLEPQTWRLKRFKDSQTTTLVRRRLIRDPIHITEEMKDQLYENMKRERHLMAMVINDEGLAQHVWKELDQGKDFSALVQDYSVYWTKNDPPGDVGWKKAGWLLWPFDKQVWDAPIGSTLGPDREAMGWYIVRVLDERPSGETRSREEMDKYLQQRLLEPLYMYRQRVVLDSLRAAADPYFPEEGKALIMSKYFWEPDPDQVNNPYARLDAKRHSPELTAAEDTIVVIGFHNKDIPNWTAKEFVQRLEWYPSGIWPTGQSESELQELYDIMVRDFLWLKAADDLGYSKDPDLLARFEKKAREMRVTYFYYKDIMGGFHLKPEEIQAWFQEHRDRYKAPPSAKLSFFASSRKKMMENLARDWRGGMSFLDLRKKYAKQDPKLISMGETPWIFTGTDPVFDEKIATLPEGAVSDPITRADTTRVYKVIAKRDTILLAYEEIKAQVDKDAKTALGDKYFQDFLEKQKKTYPVKVNEDALRRLTIPDDAAMKEEV